MKQLALPSLDCQPTKTKLKSIMRLSPFLLLYMLALLACSMEQKTVNHYPRWVGDIEHQTGLDADTFVPCHGDNNVYQYFNLLQGMQFEGEKIGLERYFRERYKPVKSRQSGWIRIRFMVNCKGETGRFRILESNENYKERAFDTRIAQQLLALTKSLKGWEILTKNNKPIDYYQYITFKITNGQIEAILP